MLGRASAVCSCAMAPSDGAPKGSRSRARAASSMSRGSGAIISSCAPAYRGYRFRTIGRVRGEGEGEGEGEDEGEG